MNERVKTINRMKRYTPFRVNDAIVSCLSVILLGLLSTMSMAATLRVMVPQEPGHPRDTLFVGRPGTVSIQLIGNVSDSIDAIVTAFVMRAASGTVLPIDPVDESDWQWLGPYSNYDIRGFNQSLQDGISPDTGLMFLTSINSSAATNADTIVGRFTVTPTGVGQLLLDTVTILNGPTQKITSVVFRSAGYVDVRSGLAFDFVPVTILQCENVSIGCHSTSVDTLLSQPKNVCIPMPIANATVVNVAHATWADGSLCFFADTAGTYRFNVFASNACSVDTCLLTVSVALGCCIGTTGNVNKSPTENPDLSDLSLLISYLTVAPRPVLPCVEEANINATSNIDISDLSLLISYLTVIPRPVLPNCP